MFTQTQLFKLQVMQFYLLGQKRSKENLKFLQITHSSLTVSQSLCEPAGVRVELSFMQRPMQSKASSPNTPPKTSSSNGSRKTRV